MCLAMALSVRLGLCPAEDAERLRRHLAAAGLPTEMPAPNGRRLAAASLIAHMRKDKKARGGRMTLILSRGIGQAFESRDVGPEALLAFLGELAGPPIAAGRN